METVRCHYLGTHELRAAIGMRTSVVAAAGLEQSVTTCDFIIVTTGVRRCVETHLFTDSYTWPSAYVQCMCSDAHQFRNLFVLKCFGYLVTVHMYKSIHTTYKPACCSYSKNLVKIGDPCISQERKLYFAFIMLLLCWCVWYAVATDNCKTTAIWMNCVLIRLNDLVSPNLVKIGDPCISQERKLYFAFIMLLLCWRVWYAVATDNCKTTAIWMNCVLIRLNDLVSPKPVRWWHPILSEGVKLHRHYRDTNTSQHVGIAPADHILHFVLVTNSAADAPL